MKVYFTERAEKEYRAIKAYLESQWGEKVGIAFDRKIKEFLIILKIFPEIGNVEVREKKILSFSVTKHTREFYRISQNKIIVFSLFDVRQNPKKNQFKKPAAMAAIPS